LCFCRYQALHEERWRMEFFAEYHKLSEEVFRREVSRAFVRNRYFLKFHSLNVFFAKNAKIHCIKKHSKKSVMWYATYNLNLKISLAKCRKNCKIFWNTPSKRYWQNCLLPLSLCFRATTCAFAQVDSENIFAFHSVLDDDENICPLKLIKSCVVVSCTTLQDFHVSLHLLLEIKLLQCCRQITVLASIY